MIFVILYGINKLTTFEYTLGWAILLLLVNLALYYFVLSDWLGNKSPKLESTLELIFTIVIFAFGVLFYSFVYESNLSLLTVKSIAEINSSIIDGYLTVEEFKVDTNSVIPTYYLAHRSRSHSKALIFCFFFEFKKSNSYSTASQNESVWFMIRLPNFYI